MTTSKGVDASEGKEISFDFATEKDPDLTFEEALERLEEVVEKLEEGDLGLDESLSLFQKGIALALPGIERCRAEAGESRGRC